MLPSLVTLIFIFCLEVGHYIYLPTWTTLPVKEIKFLVPYVLFTSLSYYFAKNGLLYSSPLVYMGLRYLIAGVILLSISKRLIINRNVFIFSCLTVSSTILWAYGLTMVSPAESAVLSYSMPLFSLPIAFVLIRERPTDLEITGTMIGFLGVVIYSLPLLHAFNIGGIFLTIGNAVFWASYTVLYRKMKDQDPIALNASQFLIGAAIMLAFSPISFRLVPSENFLIDLLWLSTLGGFLTFLLWNYMVRISKVNRITVLAFSVPALTMIISIILTRTLPEILSVVGVVVMFIGIFVSRVNRGISFVKPSRNGGK